MSLGIVPVHGGVAPLGRWGRVHLTGAATALLRLTATEDVELPAAVAADLPAGVLLLNEQMARLLFLPYVGELAAAYDLSEGTPVYEPVALPRCDEHGLRMATVFLVPRFGVVYMTEGTLACFFEDCRVAWRHDDDFGAWTIEGVNADEVMLLSEDGAGNEQRQRRAFADGRTLR